MKNKPDYTTVRLKLATVKMLQYVGRKNETYDDVIVRLVAEHDAEK